MIPVTPRLANPPAAPVEPRSGSALSPAGVEIAIDTLALHGFSPRHGERFRSALEAELGRLVAEGGLSAWTGAESGEIPALDATFTAGPHQSPEQAGIQAARAIFGGLKR